MPHGGDCPRYGGIQGSALTETTAPHLWGSFLLPRGEEEIYAHMIHGQDDEAADPWDEYQKRHAPQAVPGARKGEVQ